MKREEYDLIVRKLKSKREALKLKQEDIAKRCDCSFSTISAIERGVQVASAVNLFSYMEAVGIDVNSFITNSKAADMADSKVSDEWVRFLELLSKEEQEQLFRDLKRAKGFEPELLKMIESMTKEEQKQLIDRVETFQKVNEDLLNAIASISEENQIKMIQFIQLFR